MAGRAMNAATKAPMTTWILDPFDALDSSHAGGKARALARAARGGLSVPAWVVLSDAAFLQSNPSTLSGTPEGRTAITEYAICASEQTQKRRC
jgi:hypothetical protein